MSNKALFNLNEADGIKKTEKRLLSNNKGSKISDTKHATLASPPMQAVITEDGTELFFETELTPQSPFATNIFLQDNLISPIQVCPHWHDCFEILFVLKGSALQMLNQREFSVAENDLIIIKKGDVHSTLCKPGDDVRIMVIKFLPQFIDSIYQHSFESLYITSFLNLDSSPVKNLENKPQLPRLQEVTSALLDEFENKDAGFEIAIKGYLSVLISLLVRLDLLVIPDLLLKSSNKRNKELKILLQYIEEHATEENLDLGRVAQQMNFNYSYCSRYFKKNTGKGFHSFLTFIRICEAERMILDLGYTVTRAAIESGFSNSSVFSKAYRKLRGYPPSRLEKPPLPCN